MSYLFKLRSHSEKKKISTISLTKILLYQGRYMKLHIFELWTKRYNAWKIIDVINCGYLKFPFRVLSFHVLRILYSVFVYLSLL